MTEKKAAFISELAQNDQRAAKQQVEMTLKWLAICECYLRDYAAGTQTVFKMLQIVKETRLMTIATINELCDRHQLPDDLQEILTKGEDREFLEGLTRMRQQDRTAKDF